MVSKFLLPSPVDVVRAFVNDFPLLMANARVTILESFIGLLMGVVIGFLMAVLMDDRADADGAHGGHCAASCIVVWI